MASFDSGVTSYVHGRAIIDQYWPVDARGNECVNCAQCFYFRNSSGRCAITGEVSAFPSKFVGASCPMMNDEDFEKAVKALLT